MGRERRKFERIESLLSTKYIAKRSQITGYSLTRDVSEGGIGLPSDGRIPNGEEVNITIALHGDAQKTIPATAKVVWSRRNAEHWKSKYSAGLEFMYISPHDKQMLLDYGKENQWVKGDFEQKLEEDEIPILGKERES